MFISGFFAAFFQWRKEVRWLTNASVWQMLVGVRSREAGPSGEFPEVPYAKGREWHGSRFGFCASQSIFGAPLLSTMLRVMRKALLDRTGPGSSFTQWPKANRSQRKSFFFWCSVSLV